MPNSIALVPFLRLINGPAVTHDQFIVQVTLFTLALVGTLALRFYNWHPWRGHPAREKTM